MMLSLILPCYNPPKGWEVTAYDFFSSISLQIGKDTELIIVIDGPSPTVGSSQLEYLKKQSANITFIHSTVNKGKGHALRQGVQAAKGNIVIYTDIDFPYTMDSLLAVYNGLATQQFDIGLGVKNNDYYNHLTPIRRIISKSLQLLIQWFLSMPVTDTQCGLKGFRKEVKPLFLQTTINRYLFDLEFVHNAYNIGKYRIQAVPLQLRNDIEFRKMNYSILLPEMWNFVKLLFKKRKHIDLSA
jgi:glycosyltransferase involved in cell wall biosynthesis